ncbi:transposase family protein [Streptomyces sp. NPDC004270]
MYDAGPRACMDRDRFVSGRTKQNAVKAMVHTDTEGRMLFCSPVRPGSCADIHARQLVRAQLLADGPFVEVLANAGYQGMGAQTGGSAVAPPHRKFKKNAPAWHENGTDYYGARRTPPDASASSTASHTSKSGGPPPVTMG